MRYFSPGSTLRQTGIGAVANDFPMRTTIDGSTTYPNNDAAPFADCNCFLLSDGNDKFDVTRQTEQTLDNVKSVLEEGGAGLDDVVKCNVYLKDIADFQAMNAVFARYFPNDPPARTTVQAHLAEPEMLVEIEAVAYVE